MFVEQSYLRLQVCNPIRAMVVPVKSLIIKKTVTCLLDKERIRRELNTQIPQGLVYLTFASLETPLFSVEMRIAKEGELILWPRNSSVRDIDDLYLEGIFGYLIEKAAFEKKYLYI